MTWWCIYALKDPATMEIRYIGYTRDLTQRLLDHINSASDTCRFEKDQWICGLKRAGRYPIPEILESGIAGDWRTAEQKWISWAIDQGHKLTNKDKGGSGGNRPLKSNNRKGSTK